MDACVSQQPMRGDDKVVKNNQSHSVTTHLQCINGMKQYENKSMEVSLSVPFCCFSLYVLFQLSMLCLFCRSFACRTTRPIERVPPLEDLAEDYLILGRLAGCSEEEQLEQVFLLRLVRALEVHFRQNLFDINKKWSCTRLEGVVLEVVFHCVY